MGVRPRPPPTSTWKPSSPASLRTAFRPISCTPMAARSSLAPLMAILNLRGRKANSGRRIDDRIGGHSRELVGGGVADTVAAGLDGVHLHRGKFFPDIRHIFQSRPVELNVLAGGNVRVTLVVTTGDIGQFAQTLGREYAIGYGDTQHGCVALDVQAVLQAQRQEFCLGKLAGEIAAYLIAELPGAVLNDTLVILVVNVHSDNLLVGQSP